MATNKLTVNVEILALTNKTVTLKIADKIVICLIKELDEQQLKDMRFEYSLQ